MSTFSGGIMTGLDFLLSLGFDVTTVDFDGEIHRVATKDKPNKKNGWYMAIGWPSKFIVAGDWSKAMDRQTWSENPKKSLSRDAKKDIDKRIAEQRKLDLRAKLEQQEKCKRTSAYIVQTAKPRPSHPYTDKKKIKGDIATYKNSIAIPLNNIRNELVGLQLIHPDGEKRFLKGTQTKGAYHLINGKADIIYVCEGWATGKTINQVTGKAVYVSFSSGNLKSVTETAVFLNRSAKICIAADNDEAGVSAASDASVLTGAEILTPKCAGTDFNDLFCEQGEEKTKAQLNPLGPNSPSGLSVPEGDVEYSIIIDETLKAMRHEPTSFPKFPEKFTVKTDARGERLILVERPNKVMHEVAEQYVRTAVAQYWLNNEFHYAKPTGEIVATKKPNQLLHTSVTSVVSSWLDHCPEFPHEIAGMKTYEDDRYAFHRIDFPFKSGSTPTWDELLSRVNDPQAFLAFIGSIFVPESSRQQYLWMYGEGGDGKGSTQRFIKRVLGSAYQAKSADNINQFWSSNLLGKRLADFADCNNFQFITTGLFKQITGGDAIPIEYKGKNGFCSDLTCKVMFSSNEKPNISRKKSDLRRAIFISFKGVEPKDYIPPAIYEARLWDERAAFLHKAVSTYHSLCPTHGSIPAKEDDLNELVSENEEIWEVIAAKYFVLFKDNPLVSARKLPFVSPVVMHNCLMNEKLNFMEQRNFRRWLKSRGVTYTVVKLDNGSTERRYLNIERADASAANDIYGGNMPSDYLGN